ncbi:hypothetical protein AB1484_23040 [Parafrankia sp. FMc6]|uniref:hypothetical protein n=1 Tax=Parafrankia soli TaxID=2599596 RepID=UPI0034D7AA3F
MRSAATVFTPSFGLFRDTVPGDPGQVSGPSSQSAEDCDDGEPGCRGERMLDEELADRFERVS